MPVQKRQCRRAANAGLHALRFGGSASIPASAIAARFSTVFLACLHEGGDFRRVGDFLGDATLQRGASKLFLGFSDHLLLPIANHGEWMFAFEDLTGARREMNLERITPRFGKDAIADVEDVRQQFVIPNSAVNLMSRVRLSVRSSTIRIFPGNRPGRGFESSK